jgi:hypothetical protein
MANEATKIRLYGNNGDVADFTIADGTAISAGALLKLTDPDTAIISSAANDVCAGIAASSKEASDGSTRLGVYTNGDFKMYASGSITAGQMLVSAADANFPNYVKALLTATASGAAIIGYAKETASAGETFVARIRL